jgi:hypothetical protein
MLPDASTGREERTKQEFKGTAMPKAISHLKDIYFDLPILQIYILFVFVPLIGWFVILGWLPQVKLQTLRWMISWLLDNYHRFFPIVFVVFATTDLLARPGLTTAVDGIVVPTDSIKLTIELLDRAKIGCSSWLLRTRRHRTASLPTQGKRVHGSLRRALRKLPTFSPKALPA